MTDDYIRVGDIVEIDYITEFAKEHINEGKALVIWKGFNHQPLVRNLDTKATTWTCYEHIAKVVGHIDIVGYMDRALSAEPCDDAISRQAVINAINQNCIFENEYNLTASRIKEKVQQLPSITPKEKTGKWIRWYETIEQEHCTIHDPHCKCSECNQEYDPYIASLFNYCPNCGAKMQEVENEDSD